MRTLVFVICALVAGAPAAHAQRVESTYATVTQARAVTDGRSVAVELTIEPRSWKWLRDRSIEPILSIWVEGRRTDLKLRAGHDTLAVPLPVKLGGLSELRIALAGRGPRHSVGSMVIGGIEVVELTLKVASGQVSYDGGEAPPPPSPPPPPPPRLPNWSANPLVIKACGDTMTGSTNQEACLDAVRPYLWPPEPMVRACYRAMTGNTNTLGCIRSGAGARASAVNALEACYKAMTGNANTLACLDSAARSLLEPSPAISACARAMTGNTNVLACIGLAVASPTDPTETIASCHESMTGDTAVLGCMKRAFAPR